MIFRLVLIICVATGSCLAQEPVVIKVNTTKTIINADSSDFGRIARATCYNTYVFGAYDWGLGKAFNRDLIEFGYGKELRNNYLYRHDLSVKIPISKMTGDSLVFLLNNRVFIRPYNLLIGGGQINVIGGMEVGIGLVQKKQMERSLSGLTGLEFRCSRLNIQMLYKRNLQVLFPLGDSLFDNERTYSSVLISVGYRISQTCR